VLTTLGDIGINLLAAAIGGSVTWLYARAKASRRRRRLGKDARDFFGTEGKIMLIHSAVVDDLPAVAGGAPEKAYNYPATDIRAARNLARFFESYGLREGKERDFVIVPDFEVTIDDALWDHNLVLLCGPARNAVYRTLSPSLDMRYTMTLSPVDAERNVLTDHHRQEHLQSSRERGLPPSVGCFDYGLVVSTPSPRNTARRLVLLAGIHGTGTVAAAQFVSTASELKNLNGRRSSADTVCEVVQAMYLAADNETPTTTRLV
jgi:hypothetical protein